MHPTLALNTLKDPSFNPSSFVSIGLVAEVIAAWKAAIAAERHTDVTVTPAMLAFGPKSGALACTKDTSAGRYGYTKHAITQLFSRTAGQGMPIGSVVNTFLWTGDASDESPRAARYQSRADMWAHEILRRGDSGRDVILRLANNVHGENGSAFVRYVRAVVSDQHALTGGDDAFLILSLEESLRILKNTDYALGQATVNRDPAGLTFFKADSVRALPNNARVRLNVSNSEVGMQSARSALAISFQFTIEGKERDVQIHLTGERSTGRAIHKGNGVQVLFDALHENLAFQTTRAVMVIPAMNAQLLSYDQFFRTFRTTEEIERVQAIVADLDSQGVAKKDSMLSLALVYSILGDEGEASLVYANFSKGF